LKKSQKFDRHIIESLKLDRTLEEKAVVAFLRGARLNEVAEAILRGEHRKENS